MIFLKRKIRILLLLSILFVLYIYASNITLLPNSILLIQGEKLKLATVFGINIEEVENSNPNIGSFGKLDSLLEASSNAEQDSPGQVGKVDVNLNLFNLVPLKQVSVSVIPKMKVVPLGNAIGLKLYTKGVLIVGKTQIDGQKPYESAGIEEGDRIISIDNEEIKGTDDLIDTINNSGGREIEVKYIRDEQEKIAKLKPVQTASNEYKLGLWVRDASAGVGTASFYIPETGMFAALGHGISDIDTEKLITIGSGELVTTEIISIQKGQKGKPRRNKRLNRRKLKNRRCI